MLLATCDEGPRGGSNDIISIAVWGCLGRLLVQDCWLAGAFAGFSFRFSRDASSIANYPGPKQRRNLAVVTSSTA